MYTPDTSPTPPRWRRRLRGGARRACLSLGLALTIIACGCGDGAPDAELELGTGGAAFSPLSDGDRVSLTEGPQGGYHILLALRARHVVPARAHVTVVVHPVAGGRPRQSLALIIDLMPLGDPGSYEALGILTVLSAPQCFVGQRTQVEVTLSDAAGRTVQAERSVVIEGPALADACPVDTTADAALAAP
ncbi:MAG: hypothetical protein KC543_10935 [Myxococcales bacterium]|nr:hypothetical protein [Myxococcales bacterium]